jgi:hypothetical protein
LLVFRFCHSFAGLTRPDTVISFSLLLFSLLGWLLFVCGEWQSLLPLG